MRKLFIFLTIALTCLGSQAQAFTPTEDGLYAVFDTSMGEFTAELFFEDTQQTVASFVGLAEGTQDWLNLDTGKIQVDTPYFDGQMFHRVIAGFMIQAGGREKGVGTTPGYNILNEIIPDDAKFSHDRAGILSMANTAKANSGGAQFFVTVAPATHLDGKHTVFGEVVEGQDIVDAISTTPVSSDVPVDDVFINSITIVREGQAAIDFDPTAYNVPTFEEPGPAFSANLDSEDKVTITLDVNRTTDYSIYMSTDLESWSYFGSVSRLNYDIGPNTYTTGADLPAGGRGFWSAVNAHYPKLADKAGHSIVATNVPDAPSLSHTISLAADYKGTIEIAGLGTRDILYYFWHTYANDMVTLTVFGDGLIPLQYTFIEGASGNIQFYVEDTDPDPNVDNSYVRRDLTFEQTYPVP